MPTSLEVYNAFVEANRKSVQNRIDMMKAYADYNYRMFEAAKLQEEISRMQLETAAERARYKRIKRAAKRFERALKDVRNKYKKKEKEAVRIQRNALRVTLFEQCEILPARSVPLAWAAVYFFVNTDSSVVRQLKKIVVTSQERRGDYYSRNRYPDKKIANAPAGKKSAWSLMNWARDYPLLMPKEKTPAATFFERVVDTLTQHFEEASEEVEEEMEDLAVQLEELNERDWKKIDVEKEKPKKPK